MFRRLSNEIRLGTGRWSLAALLLAAAVALPLLAIALNLFRGDAGSWEHLSGQIFRVYLKNSLILVVAVSLLATAAAIPAAWIIATCQFPGRRIFEWALVLPLALPTYVAAYAYSDILEATFPIQVWIKNNWGFDIYLTAEVILRYGVASLILAAVLYPYVYLAARTAFSMQARSSIEAARSLGSGLSGTFFRVALPMARPAIAAGLALVIMEVLNDYGAVSFLGIPTLSVGIFRTWLGLGDPVSAVRLSAIVMFFAMGALWLERKSRGRAAFVEKGGDPRPLTRMPLRPLPALAAILLCLTPLAIGFLIPCAKLASWAIPTLSDVVGSKLWLTLFKSIFLAAAATLCIVGGGLLLAYTHRAEPTRLVAGATRIATLGYAVPGAVIAVGILIPCGLLGQRTGLVLSGTVLALGFAYMVRFLAVAHGALESAMARSCKHLDEASRSLGHGAGSTLRRVILPLIRGPLIAAGLLVFIDVLKELPLTLILRPFNFETLATTAHSLASEGRIRECAVPSLLIIVIGALGAIPLNRLMRQL